MGSLRRAASVGAVLCLLAGVFAAGGMARATTFVMMDERDLAATSDAAVVGEVVRVESVEDPSSGAIRTIVVVQSSTVLFGEVRRGPVVITELGGKVGERSEKVFGSPAYSKGAKILVFLRRDRAGRWRTAAMAMGKYDLELERRGTIVASRTFDDEVTFLDAGFRRLGARQARERVPLTRILAAIDAAHPGRSRRRRLLRLGESRREAPAFTLLGGPSRWFEPDVRVAVEFLTDSRGDAKFGLGATRDAVNDALAAWSSIPGASLLLADGGLTSIAPFNSCEGPNRVIFNDPYDEIVTARNCGGVLAIGGFCFTDGESRRVSGLTFNRITVGKVTFANGWTDCPAWTACNVAEVITHEIGHAVGFGHSAIASATMAGTAHFDGRCASLTDDDVAAAEFVYPLATTPAFTRTPTITPAASRTPTRTPSEPAAPTSTATASPTRTPTTTPADPTATPAFDRPVSLAGRVTYYGSDLAIPGVVVSLSGLPASSIATDEAGSFLFAGLSPGTRSLVPSMEPDSGGAISSLDAAWVLQAAVGMRHLDARRGLACDVTGNGTVSALDAAYILQLKVGEMRRFPVAESCDSDWLFVPDPIAAPGQEIVPPFVSGAQCRPGAISFTPHASDVTGQDFRAVLLGDCTGNWQPLSMRTHGSALDDAPQGTAVVLRALRPMLGGRLRLPIAVESKEPVHSIDVQLRYDASRLRLREARPIDRDAALLRVNEDVPGRLNLAWASALPIDGDGQIVVAVEFQSQLGFANVPAVHLYSAAVNEQSVVRR